MYYLFISKTFNGLPASTYQTKHNNEDLYTDVSGVFVIIEIIVILLYITYFLL